MLFVIEIFFFFLAAKSLPSCTESRCTLLPFRSICFSVILLARVCLKKYKRLTVQQFAILINAVFASNLESETQYMYSSDDSSTGFCQSSIYSNGVAFWTFQKVMNLSFLLRDNLCVGVFDEPQKYTDESYIEYTWQTARRWLLSILPQCLGQLKMHLSWSMPHVCVASRGIGIEKNEI